MVPVATGWFGYVVPALQSAFGGAIVVHRLCMRGMQLIIGQK